MLPGLSVAPLMAAPMVVAPARRKLTLGSIRNSNTYRPGGDIEFYMESYVNAMGVHSSPAGTPLVGGNRHSNACVRKGASSSPYDWNVLSTAYTWSAFSTSLDLPAGLSVGSINILWSSATNFDVGTGNVSITIPLQSQWRKPCIVIGVWGTGNSSQYGLNPTWVSPEGYDVQAVRTGDNGKISIMRAALYADGAPDHDVIIRSDKQNSSTLIGAIVEF